MDDASPSPLGVRSGSARFINERTFGRSVVDSCIDTLRSVVDSCIDTLSPQKSSEPESRPPDEIADSGRRMALSFESADEDAEQKKIQPGAVVWYKGPGTVQWDTGTVVDPNGPPPRASGPHSMNPVDSSFKTLVAADEVKVMYRVPIGRYGFTKPVFTNHKINDLAIYSATESDIEGNESASESNEPKCKSDAHGEKFRHESKTDGESETDGDADDGEDDDGEDDDDEDEDGSGAEERQSESDEPKCDYDADGEKFRHESETDGKSETDGDADDGEDDDGDGEDDDDEDGSGAAERQSTLDEHSGFLPYVSRANVLKKAAERPKENENRHRESLIGSVHVDGTEDVQMVMEVEYVVGRASANKEFPKLARADSAGIEKFVRKAISIGVQYKVKWKGEQRLAVADAHKSFALQIANFELGYKFRDAQIVKSENDRARYRAVGAAVTVGGTRHGAVGGIRNATSKRKR